jgi:hypothetical protein
MMIHIPISFSIEREKIFGMNLVNNFSSQVVVCKKSAVFIKKED